MVVAVRAARSSRSEGSGRWHRQRSQQDRHQRTGRYLDYAGWRLCLPDLRECLEAGGLCDALRDGVERAGRFAQGDHEREDPLQQPAGFGGILIRSPNCRTIRLGGNLGQRMCGS